MFCCGDGVSFRQVCLLLQVAVVAVSATSNTAQLVSIAVVHRHGARWPMPQVNATAIVGSKYGMLNPTGAAMLTGLGASLRAFYTAGNRSLGDRVAFPATYDPRTASSSSSYTMRTLQSSQYFVRGLFNASMEGSGPDVAPATATEPLNANRELLVWTGWPSLVLWSAAMAAPFNAGAVEELVKLTSQFSSASGKQHTTIDYHLLDEIIAVGIEYGLGLECPPRASWPSEQQPSLSLVSCALDVQDLWESYSTTAATPTAFAAAHPRLAALGPVLNAYVMLYNGLSWYNASDPFLGPRAMGAKGYYLVRDIVARGKAAAAHAKQRWSAESNATVEVAVHEYSGHDITIMPLCESIGNDTLRRPVYAATLIFEHWLDPATWAMTVRAYYGQPELQSAAGEVPRRYRYDFQPTPLRCVSRNTTTIVTAEGCDADDWQRFLATRYSSATSDPACYLPRDILAFADCAVEREGPPAPLGVCGVFRSRCPRDACNATAPSPSTSDNDDDDSDNARYLSYSLQCVGRVGAGPRSGGGTWRVATIVVATVGAIAVLVGGMLWLWGSKHSHSGASGVEEGTPSTTRRDENAAADGSTRRLLPSQPTTN